MNNEEAPAKYSPAWIKQQVVEKQATFLPVSNCSICKVPYGYHFEQEGEVVMYSSACGCPTGWSGSHVAEKDYNYLGIWLSLQKTDEARDKIMEGLQ